MREDALGAAAATSRCRSARSGRTSHDDLARDITRLLASGAHVRRARPLEPRDVAVIAYQHNDLQPAQRGPAEVGVPAVVAGSGSVFATPAATEWLRLLEALEQPHRCRARPRRRR